MKRILFCALALLLVAWAAPGASGQSTFTFGFTGQDVFSGDEGAAVGGLYTCTLTHAGDPPGAQGWSLAVAAENAAITGITYAGTDAAQGETGGFASVELTTGAGNEGAVEAIVLSFKKPITLPVNGTGTCAIIDVAAVIPADTGSFRLLYKDNLQGSGEPVPNNVTQGGETRIPALTDKTVVLRKIISCTTKPINLGFSPTMITGETTPWAGVAGTDGSGGSIVRKSAAGAVDPPKQLVYADIISQLQDAEAGIQGWSLSVGSMNGSEGAIVSATYAGTIAAQAETGGFASVELIDPALPENAALGVNSGAVEAIVLSFKKPVTLPTTGVESGLELEVQAAGPQTDADQVVTLKFVGGLKGSGEPVPNSMTVGGETQKACNTLDADVKVVFSKTDIVLFVRGNANNDAKVDIADAIYIINALFRQGPPFSCLDAADMNGDSATDASDAVYLIQYLFSAGPAPSAPFPGCGPAANALTCSTEQTYCQ
jgi:hypothetical protein